MRLTNKGSLKLPKNYTSNSFQSNSLYLPILLVLLSSFIIAYFPVMELLVKVWWRSEDYSHGFFIIPLFFYIVWRKRENILYRTPIRSNWFGLVIVIISLFAYILAQFAEIRTLSSISMLACIMGGTLYLLGPQVVKELAFPFFLLLFMIPVPAQIYAKLTIPLQLMVTKVSALIAELFGIPVYCTGNILEAPGLSLRVVDACSGMRSIMTLLLLSALFAFFSLRSKLGKTVLFLFGIPVAILINILRVTGIFLAWQFFGYNLSHGFTHKLFGIVLFGIALACLFGIQRGIFQWERIALSK